MKPASVAQIKSELKNLDKEKLVEINLKLARFKKENKELLSYLLFEEGNEDDYIAEIKREMDELFEQINVSSIYYIKKSIRKILRNVKKYIRYSKLPATEAELLLYFCSKVKDFEPNVLGNVSMKNLYLRQVQLIRKAIAKLHEDLQYDFKLELNQLG